MKFSVVVLCVLVALLGLAGSGNAGQAPSTLGTILSVDCAAGLVFIEDASGTIQKVPIAPSVSTKLCGQTGQQQTVQPASSSSSGIVPALILLGGLYVLSTLADGYRPYYYDGYRPYYYGYRYYGGRWCDGGVAPGAQYLDPHCW